MGDVPIIFEDRRFGRFNISQAEIVKARQTIGWLSARRLEGYLRPAAVSRPLEP